MPEQLVAAALDAQRRFFALPLEQKQAIAANKAYRWVGDAQLSKGRKQCLIDALPDACLLPSSSRSGFTPFAEETLDPAGSRRGDTHEGLYFGRHVEQGSAEAQLPLHGPNQWPAEELVPGYRAATEAYQEAVTALGHRLLRLLGTSLGLGPHGFDPFFTRPMVRPGSRCLLLLAATAAWCRCSAGNQSSSR